MTPLVENLRRASKAVYLATDEPVAASISNIMVLAADEIERLLDVNNKLSGKLNDVNRTYDSGGARWDNGVMDS